MFRVGNLHYDLAERTRGFATRHYMMLQRNLLYMAITRSRKLVVLVGTRKALAIAVKNMDARRRVTLLKQRLTAARDERQSSGRR